ncbi:MAG: tetratricopeptide repeat protein [Nannocystales bacterium]
MRRILLLLALSVPVVAVASGCPLGSRQRVQSTNRMNEGIKAEKKGNTSSAERYLKEAIEIDPTHSKAHYTLGLVYQKQSKLVDAAKAFEDAVETMGDAPDANYIFKLGVVTAAQGEQPGAAQADKEAKYKEAITKYQETLKLDPNHYQASYRMGVLYERLDNPVQADTAFRKAIELNATFSASFVSLGNMYIDYGHANVGQAVLETGVKVNDKDADMWNGLGRAQRALNKPKEAVDSFKTAKAIDPDMPDVLFGLGMAYADLRQRNEAVEALQGFLSKAGNDVPEHLKKAANSTIARMQDVI